MDYPNGSLLDRYVFELGEEDWEAFVSILDDPYRGHPCLEVFVAREPYWDRRG